MSVLAILSDLSESWIDLRRIVDSFAQNNHIMTIKLSSPFSYPNA